MRRKLTILGPAAIGVALVVLGFTVSHWFFLPYAAAGMVFARLNLGKVGPVGYAVFALVWLYFPVQAAALCWSSPFRDKNMAQMMRNGQAMPHW